LDSSKPKEVAHVPPGRNSRTIVWEPPLAAEELGKFSLKLPFGQFHICQELRRKLFIAIASAAVGENHHQFWA